MYRNEGEQVNHKLRNRHRLNFASANWIQRWFMPELGTLLRIVAKAMLIALALIMLLVGVAVVLGGGFGAKQIGLSGTLHTNEPLIMAHRGLWRDVPQNSWAAFNAAREAGFNAVEIDVKRSADGHFYLFHDRESIHLLGVDIDLRRQPLEALQRFPLHHKGRPTTERILSLEDFAAEFADEFVVYLHIKRHGNDDLQRLGTEIADFIKRHELQERTIVGGDFLFIAWFEYRYPAFYTSLDGPGDLRARAFRLIPMRFRPDFMTARANEITSGLVQWLQQSALINRWIVSSVNDGNREQAEQWGFTKLLID